jgi:hypothetical protein
MDGGAKEKGMGENSKIGEMRRAMEEMREKTKHTSL